MDYAALKSELQKDPNNLGYASGLAVGDCTALAALLNAPGAGTVSVPVLTRDAFLLQIAPAYLVLPTLSSALQAKWDRILTVVSAVSQIDMTSKNVLGLISTAVNDGVLTSQQANAVNQRTGSRAEVLFGAGVSVSDSDIAKAVNN